MNETHYIYDLKVEIVDINATDCPYRVTNLVTGEAFMCLVESIAWHNCATLLLGTKSNQDYLLYSLNHPDHEAVKLAPVSKPIQYVEVEGETVVFSDELFYWDCDGQWHWEPQPDHPWEPQPDPDKWIEDLANSR